MVTDNSNCPPPPMKEPLTSKRTGSKVSARATVQIVVQVKSTSTWGDDCTAGQIHSEAGRECKALIESTLLKAGIRCTIVDEPKVTGVLTEREG